MKLGNILGFSLGCSVGWLSPMLPILLSDASPLAEGKITIEDAGWIASLFPLSAVFGTLSFGFLSNCIGSKRALLLCCIPVSVNLEDERNRATKDYIGIFIFADIMVLDNFRAIYLAHLSCTGICRIYCWRNIPLYSTICC